MSKYVIFHHDDLDGQASGAIIKNYMLKTYGEKVESKIHTYECDYDIDNQKKLIEEAAITKDDVVYIVDFCFDTDIMDYIYSIVEKNMVWIDHHITAFQKMKDKQDMIVGVRHKDYSATYLCWTYCFSTENMPIWVKYIDTFDCWKNEDKEQWENIIMPFKYGMESQITDLNDPSNIWDIFFNEEPNSIVESLIIKGKIIKQYITKRNTEQAKKAAYVIKFEGKKALVINKMGQGSLSLDPIFDEDEHDMMITYSIGSDKKVYVGLYTPKQHIHVGNIAKKYGGGGHQGAAGFQLTVDQLSLLL